MATAQFVVRMPPEIRAWIAGTAEKDDRSMNSLIVSILKRAMGAQNENAPAAVTAGAPN